MGHHGKHLLQPGSLSITISLPTLAPYQPLPADVYPPYLLRDFDPTKYETAVANGFGREEFVWGLYWLPDEESDGLWYFLHRQRQQQKQPDFFDDQTSQSSLSSSPDDSCTLNNLYRVPLSPSSMRLNPNIVGLIRVMTLPASVAADMSVYLNWLTAYTGPTARRSFLWATSAYMRCRMHVAHTYADGDGGNPFDVNRFLSSALAFAYGEVWHLLVGGRLPRPVMVSEFGVELQALEEDKGDMDQEEATASSAGNEHGKDELWKCNGTTGNVSLVDREEGLRHERESKAQLHAMIRRLGLNRKGLSEKSQ